MKLKKSQVIHISHLAKLKLSSKEIETFTKQLNEIFTYVSALSEINLDGVDPTSQTTGIVNSLREDEINNFGLKQSEVLSGSDNTHNGYFMVSHLLENKK